MSEPTINPSGNPHVTTSEDDSERYTRDDFIRDLNTATPPEVPDERSERDSKESA
jgi:hypothetical protein